MTFVPYADPEALQCVAIVRISATRCLIDAIQLEEGTPTLYKPHELELFVLIPRDPNRSHVTFFYNGERIPVVVVVQTKGPRKIDANVVVRDFWMKERVRQPVTLSIKEGKVIDFANLCLPPLPPGAYRVHVEAGQYKSRSIQFGFISRELSE